VRWIKARFPMDLRWIKADLGSCSGPCAVRNARGEFASSRVDAPEERVRPRC